MFTCKYADYISRDKPITFTQVSPSCFSCPCLFLSFGSAWPTTGSSHRQTVLGTLGEAPLRISDVHARHGLYSWT